MADDPIVEPNGVKKSISRSMVAAVTILGSFTLFGIVARGWCDIQWKDVILMIVGSVIANLTTVVNWYFGSSEDSSKKTDMLVAK